MRGEICVHADVKTTNTSSEEGQVRTQKVSEEDNLGPVAETQASWRTGASEEGKLRLSQKIKDSGSSAAR